MAYYNPEPSHQHSVTSKTGILLLNLGTPDAPTAKALHRYLGQFLMDRRVIEIPRFIWCWILHCIILVVRPKKSAEKYAQIWSAEGSPLLVHVQKQGKLFSGFLGQKINSPFAVEIGMAYGNPSIKTAIESLKQQRCDNILVFPLYPQYAASSTAAGMDAVWRVLLKMRNVPAIRSIKHYHDHPAYIQALANHIRQYWMIHGRPDKLVMSFHGVPRFHLDKGDPYHCECHKTARLLAEALTLTLAQYQIAFQSRFGRQEWLKPYLANTLETLGKAKIGRVDVICPGFTSDCLETLEEIAIEGKHIFQSNGGGQYHYIPALNENEGWINAMTEIALDNLHGWATQDWNKNMHDEALRDTMTRAKSLGAKQ